MSTVSCSTDAPRWPGPPSTSTTSPPTARTRAPARVLGGEGPDDEAAGPLPLPPGRPGRALGGTLLALRPGGTGDPARLGLVGLPRLCRCVGAHAHGVRVQAAGPRRALRGPD